MEPLPPPLNYAITYIGAPSLGYIYSLLALPVQFFSGFVLMEAFSIKIFNQHESQSRIR